MVNNSTKKKLKKRIGRRLNTYKLKLLVLFLVVFATTSIFVSFFVGTSSVLQSVENFNSDYNVEDGTFITIEAPKTLKNIDYEEIKYGEIRQDGTTIRIFQEREKSTSTKLQMVKMFRVLMKY